MTYEFRGTTQKIEHVTELSILCLKSILPYKLSSIRTHLSAQYRSPAILPSIYSRMPAKEQEGLLEGHFSIGFWRFFHSFTSGKFASVLLYLWLLGKAEQL